MTGLPADRMSGVSCACTEPDQLSNLNFVPGVTASLATCTKSTVPIDGTNLFSSHEPAASDMSVMAMSYCMKSYGPCTSWPGVVDSIVMLSVTEVPTCTPSAES